MITVKPVTASALLSGYTRVAAVVTHGWLRRERLWFDVPQSHAGAVNRSGDGWLMALLPLAFERGETLQVQAPVDPVLLQNAEKIQRIWSEWFPPRKPVRVNVERLAEPSPANGGKTGLFFSGGVDSFFSLLHFDKVAGDGRKIDDLICVWGFDIPLRNREAFEGKLKTLSQISSQFGKSLIPVVTNLRQTRLRKLDWGTRLHGPALGAMGLLLGARFKDILISSTVAPSNMIPWGSHPMTDPLMSSGRTQFVHYGASFDRFAKIELVAESEVALKHLHVCFEGRSDRNCGVCGKCYRTLLAFELLGVRKRAVSFPQDNFTLERLKSMRVEDSLTLGRYKELRKAALERSRPDVVAAIDACLTANGAPP
jgi:hypothetical protein